MRKRTRFYRLLTIILSLGVSLFLWNCEKEEIILSKTKKEETLFNSKNIKIISVDSLPKHITAKLFNLSKIPSHATAFKKSFSKQDFLNNYFETTASVITNEYGVTTYAVPIKKEIGIDAFFKKPLQRVNQRSCNYDPVIGPSYEVVALTDEVDHGGIITGTSTFIEFSNVNNNILQTGFTNPNTGIVFLTYSPITTASTTTSSGSWNILNQIWTAVQSLTTRIWNGISNWFDRLFSSRKKRCPKPNSSRSASRSSGSDLDSGCDDKTQLRRTTAEINLDFDIPLPESLFNQTGINVTTTENDFDCACDNDQPIGIVAFLELFGELALFLLDDEQKELRDKICKFVKDNNHSTEAKNFAKLAIDFLRNNTQFDFDYLLNNRTDFDSNQEEIENYTSGGYDTTSYSDFNPQQQPWSTIPPVIPSSDFVGWGTPGINRNCMEYSKAQIAKKGYQISNYFNSSGQTVQIYTSQNGVNQNELQRGLSYLNYALSNGIPVIVGVDDDPNGTKNPQTDNTTDHFIVIVGMGSDTNGNYFSFYDNASSNVNQGTNSLNKLYHSPSNGLISGTSQTSYASGLNYIITMIRKSKLL